LKFHKNLIFRVHAVQRMFSRNISEIEVHEVLKNGDVIEEYLEDKPYPSCLIFCHVKSRPLHIVTAINNEEKITIIITVYEPDPHLWENDFKKRRKT